MKKARWILAVGLLVLLTCAGFYFLHDDASPGVTRANFDRIEKGMTFAEVEAIFGGPPPQVSVPWDGWQVSEKHELTTCVWTDGSGEAFLNFDKTGRVMSRGWRPWYRRKWEEFQRWVFPN